MQFVIFLLQNLEPIYYGTHEKNIKCSLLSSDFKISNLFIMEPMKKI